MPTLAELEAGSPTSEPPDIPAPTRPRGRTLSEMEGSAASSADTTGTQNYEPTGYAAMLPTLMKGIQEISDRSSQAVGGPMASLAGQSKLNPFEAAYRGIVYKDQPRPADVYERAGYKNIMSPGVAEAISQGARSAGVPLSPEMASAPTSAEGLGFATELAPQLLLDPLAGAASIPLKAAGRGLGALRGVPGIRNVGSAFSRGFSIVNPADREAIRGIFESSRGVGRNLEDVSDKALNEAESLIRTAAKKKGEDPSVTEKFVRDLQETRHRDPAIAAAALPEEHQAADILQGLADKLPEARLKEGLRAAELAVEKAGQAVKYTPRIPEKGLQKVLGTAGGRQIGLSELEPKLPGHRVTPREMTTGELERSIEQGVIRGTPVKNPLKPLLQAFDIRSKGTARAASNARAINNIAMKFGVHESKAGPGFRSMSELGILSEYQPGLKKMLGSTYVHPEVFRYMDDFSRATLPKNIPVLHGFVKAWKPVVTSINPGFIGRNFQWNGVVGWIFGNRDPRNWKIAADVISESNPEAIIKGIGVSHAALKKEMVQLGVIRSGIRQELGIGTKRIVRPGTERVVEAATAPFRAGSSLNAAGEDLARASFYKAMRSKGMSPEKAAKEVRRVYFDYSRDAFTRGENWVRENLVPFYSWTRRIIPLTFRGLAEHPSAFAGIGSLEHATARAQGAKSEDVRKFGPEFQETPGLVLPNYPGQEKGTYRAIPLNAIGFFDPARTAQTLGEGPRALLEQAISASNPMLKLGYEGIFGKNTFTGRDNTGRPVRLPSWIGAVRGLNKPLADKLGIVRANDGWYGPDYLYSALSTPGPLPSAMGDLYLASKGDRKAGGRAIRWISGVKVSEGLSPTKTRQYEEFGKALKLREDLKRGRKNAGARARLEAAAGPPNG